MKDITAQYSLVKIKSHANYLNLLTSNVSHELITPTRCIILFAEKLLEVLKGTKNEQDANLIVTTAYLLLNQLSMLLDKSLIENNRFSPSLKSEDLLKIVDQAIQIL
jgi:signal transduction histidine kinase